MKVLVYRKCSTCIKALKWLDEHNISYEERAIKEENPTYEELKEWYTKSGLPLKKFFNTSGMLYKEMKLHGYAGGKVRIGHNFNLAGAHQLRDMILEEFPGADIGIEQSTGLCLFYAEEGGMLVGYEDKDA